MLWDPLNAWPKGRRWLWAVLAGLVCLTQGPEFLRSLRPARDRWTDFFQEWASAHNYCCGLPIYTDHQFAVERHLGYYRDGEGPNIHKSANLIKVNAHPPTSVLLALPLAAFDYPDAVLAWNLLSLGALLLSLWLVARALAIPVSAWSVVPLVTLLLLCNPFRAQVFYGQLSLVLLLLLTGTWIAHRSNRPIGAGVLLGLAVAVKLFPAFLFVFFVLRRQWKTVAAGILTLLVATVLTAAVLGMDAYRIYAREVVPQVALFRNGWCNASLPGLWTKLFDPRNTRIEPLYGSVLIAQVGTWISCGLLVAVLAWITLRGGQEGEDRAFALTVTAMLLVSPITWDHYSLLLLVPLAVAWTRLPATNLARMTFLTIVFLLWMKPDVLYQAFIPGGAASGIATSFQTLCILSLPCYALLLLFALLAGLLPQKKFEIRNPKSERKTKIEFPKSETPCSNRFGFSSSSLRFLSDFGFRISDFRTETGIFLGIWLILLIGARSRLFRDPGTLWHPVVGARILSDRECLRTDPFSFTHSGEPWIAQGWLGECVLAGVYGLAGLDGLLLATATVLAGLYTWVAHRLLRAGVHPLLAVFLTACAILASSYHFHPRPHLITIILMGWTFARLCDWEAGRISTGRLFWLVPLFLLWANIHGGMVGGVAMLAVCVTGWIWSRSARGTYRQLVMLVILVIACGLTALINPFGLALPRVWFSLMTSAVLPEIMEEHAPLRYSPEGWPVLFFGLIYVLALVGTLPRRPRVTWLIPLLWLALAWTRIRHGPLFAITAGIALADMLPEVRWARWLARRGSALFQLRSPEGQSGRGAVDWRAAIVPTVLVMTAALLQLAAVPFPVLGRGWAKLDRTLWPVDLLPELRAYARNQPDGTAIFNDMHFGGFLIRYTPRLRVFIDDRCELYGDEGLLAYAQAARDDPGQIERWAGEYGFRLALVQSESRFDHYLQGAHEWRLVRRTAAAALFERIRETNNDTVSSRGHAPRRRGSS